MLTAEELEKAREKMLDAFAKWNRIDAISDPVLEEIAWAEYVVKVKKYNAMYIELGNTELSYKGR